MTLTGTDTLELERPPAILPPPAALRAVDRVHAWIAAALQPIELPLSHTFTPGLYTRRIFMPAGACIVSKIHRTQHPFVILTGAVRVWDAATGTVELRAPHFGITQPATRRVLYILEDCIWATFHATPHTTPEAVEADIIEPYTVPDEILAEAREALKIPSPEPLAERSPP